MHAKQEDIQKIESRLNNLDKRITDAETWLRQSKPSPILEIADDIATLEAIYGVLLDKEIVTQPELGKYMDQYKQHVATILHILIDKGITTPKEYQCRILAFHHMYRLHGINAGIDQKTLDDERKAYEKMLMEKKDPLECIGL
jgi:hypothetical protein